MITDSISFDKPLTQENYNKCIGHLNLFNFSCPCCHMHGQLERHAYYVRYIKTDTGKIPLNILRLRCRHCETTHALVPDSIVPYSQHLLEDQLSIIREFENGSKPYQIQPSNPEIDTPNVAYIIKQYLRYWKQRLLSFGCSVFVGKFTLIINCFSNHNRQFMQVKQVANCLYS